MVGKLSPRQARYCLLRVEGASQEDAYIRAGYSPRGAENNACRLDQKPQIKAYIAELQQQAADARIPAAARTKESVLEKLETIRDMCLREETFTPTAAIRACELIGKEMGMFVERRENTNRNIESMTQEELVEYRAEIKRRKEELDQMKERLREQGKLSAIKAA